MWRKVDKRRLVNQDEYTSKAKENVNSEIENYVENENDNKSKDKKEIKRK
ncbi:hypothetical protein [Oceanobacillus manasiensis]|nr:hypothetical protein [Oceanobacillus manasiensis]